MAMVLRLHQGNFYTKRKLTVWRDQKCNPVGGAITPLTCGAIKISRLEGGSTVHTYDPGTVFTPRKYLHQMEATGMERPEMCSVSGCNNPTYLQGPSKYPVSREAVHGPVRKVW